MEAMDETKNFKLRNNLSPIEFWRTDVLCRSVNWYV
jgi:hypothetical protein